MKRGITLEALLMLDEPQIKQSFPHGARTVGDRWEPADSPENAGKTLDRLLKEKRQRREQPRYLRQSYSRDNYTHIPNQAMGKDKHGRGAPEEAVPKDVQERFTREAHLKGHRALHERLKDLEERAEPHQLESLERRISGLERSLHEKAA